MRSLLKKSFFREYNHNILHVLAERSGKHETIKKAIINGGNVNILNNRKYTPLHSAVERGNILNVNTLLKHSADITMVTDKCKTVLHLATISNNHVLLESLISQAANMNLIHRIVNMYDSNGETALTIAIKSKNIHTVKLLLANNANIYDRNYQYMTPFMLAYSIKSVEIMKLLHAKDKGLVDNADDKGNSSLMDAIMKNDEELIKVLLTMSPDLTIRNVELKDALSLCKSSNNSENLSALLQGLKVTEITTPW